MTTTLTLTERYLDAALRRVPSTQRKDVERELRASIADAVDARIEGGSTPAEAEKAVLTDLGDPAVLAAGMADRPLHLIGPSVYLDYTRLLTALLATVVPIVAVASATAQVLRGTPALSVITDVLATAIAVGVHIALWTTVLFALIERVPSLRWGPARPWTLADLPEPPTRPMRYGELIGETVMVALFTAFVLVSPKLPIKVSTDGGPISVLDPWLWESGVIYLFLAVAVAALGLTYVRFYVRWNAALALLSALVSAAGPAILIFIGSHERLLNPTFVATVGMSADVIKWINTGLIIVGSLSILHTLIELVVRLVSKSWAATDLGALIRSGVRGLTRAPGRIDSSR